MAVESSLGGFVSAPAPARASPPEAAAGQEIWGDLTARTDSLAIRQQALDMRLAHADRLLDAATSGVLAQAAAGVLR